MSGVFVRMLLGLAVSLSVAAAAARLNALTLDGAAAATVVGTVVFTAGGFGWSALLVLFFVTSSALSRLSPRLSAISDQITAKADRRDAFQVLANGGIPAIIALLAVLRSAPPWLPPFAGAVAAATADTWATEIGAWSRTPPVHILTGVSVPAGTSGGVTRLGLAASAAGALLIALAAWMVFHVGALAFLGIALGGLAGSLVDSLLGATVQERRRCPQCGTFTEQTVHRPCRTRTTVVGGWQGINNDAVNVLASAAGSLVALFLATLASGA